MAESCDEEFVPELYCLFFHNNVCHVCKKTENLLRCSQCKILAYCSKNHQKLDWKIHKQICSVFASASFDMGANNFEDYVTIKKLRYSHLKKKLGRELFNYEMQMWMFPRFCEVCFTEKVLLECEKCRNVFFCSENHRDKFRKQHEKHCEELRLQLQIILRKDVLDSNFSVSVIPQHIMNLPDTHIELLQLYDEGATNNANLMQNLIKLKFISPVASILYSLEKSGHVKDRLYDKNELNIHIVGADISEICLLWKEMFELAFHWINNLEVLQYFIIGPKLGHNSHITTITKDLCATCRNKNLKASSTFLTQLYHDVVNQINNPDVIVAFNSGLHKNSTKTGISPKDYDPEHMWEESIQYLVKHTDVPLILTAYTYDELVCDVEEVKKYAKHGIKILVEPRKNPFHDGTPMRDFESTIEPVYYVNGYIAVLTSC